MTGYENMLAIIYHSGPPIYAYQSLKVKMIDMTSRNYKILCDIECPLSRDSNLIWAGFSEEG